MCGVTQWANLKSAAHIIHYSAIPDMVSGLTMGGAELKRYCEQWTQFRASWCCQAGTVRLGEPSPLPTQHVTMLWPFCTLQFMTHSGTISDVPINIFCRKDKQVEFQSCVMLQAAGIILAQVIIIPLTTWHWRALVTNSLFLLLMNVSALFPIFTPFSRIAKNIRDRH